MDFKDFLNKPMREFDLFFAIAQHIQKNFFKFHGQNIFFHIADEGDFESSLSHLKYFSDLYEMGDYVYIEHYLEPKILMRSDSSSIAMLLSGEHQFAELKINHNEIQIKNGPNEATLPANRASQLSAIQKMEAFGLIGNLLQESKRNKA